MSSVRSPHAPDINNLPTPFIPNAGQTGPNVHFTACSLGGPVFFTPGEVVFALPPPELVAAQRERGHKDPTHHERIKAAIANPPTVLRIQFDCS